MQTKRCPGIGHLTVYLDANTGYPINRPISFGVLLHRFDTIGQTKTTPADSRGSAGEGSGAGTPVSGTRRFTSRGPITTSVSDYRFIGFRLSRFTENTNSTRRYPRKSTRLLRSSTLLRSHERSGWYLARIYGCFSAIAPTAAASSTIAPTTTRAIDQWTSRPTVRAPAALPALPDSRPPASQDLRERLLEALRQQPEEILTATMH